MSKLDERPRVLCVDDEAAVLGGLVRVLRKEFALRTEGDGQSGLEALATSGPFEVVMSDLNMPRMNGIAFLAAAEKAAPDTVRILLTGNAELSTAVDAINQGRIFRFLCKPTAPDDLVATIRAATEQHSLIVAERELLERTLRGSVQTLLDTLSLANPRAFARASRIRRLVMEQIAALGVDDWSIEVAAMLSQLGAVTLPADVATKLDLGEPLNPDERESVDRMPAISEQLLAHIPRLEPVRQIIREQRRDAAPDVPLGARMLRVALDLVDLEGRGLSRDDSLRELRGNAQLYDPQLLDAVTPGAGRVEEVEVVEIAPHELRGGMVLVKDLCASDGVLLVGRGHEVNDSMLELIRNHVQRGRVTGSVFVTVPR